MLQAEGGGLVPLINVSLPTLWERGQVWRWTKLFIYFLIVKQPACHPRCFVYLCVCCKWKVVRSKVMLLHVRKNAWAGSYLASNKDNSHKKRKKKLILLLIPHEHGEEWVRVCVWKLWIQLRGNFFVLYQEKSGKSPKERKEGRKKKLQISNIRFAHEGPDNSTHLSCFIKVTSDYEKYSEKMLD